MKNEHKDGLQIFKYVLEKKVQIIDDLYEEL